VSFEKAPLQTSCVQRLVYSRSHISVSVAQKLLLAQWDRLQHFTATVADGEQDFREYSYRPSTGQNWTSGRFQIRQNTARRSRGLSTTPELLFESTVTANVHIVRHTALSISAEPNRSLTGW